MTEKRWTQQQEPETLAEATVLWELLKVVRAGGTMTITGSGPLSSPAAPQFTMRLQSHSGARYASAEGSTLATCLQQGADRWQRL